MASRLPQTRAGFSIETLRLPLAGLGIFEPELRAPLLDTNVNLYAGIAMAVFGGVMLWLARKRA